MHALFKLADELLLDLCNHYMFEMKIEGKTLFLFHRIKAIIAPLRDAVVTERALTQGLAQGPVHDLDLVLAPDHRRSVQGNLCCIVEHKLNVQVGREGQEKGWLVLITIFVFYVAEQL